MVRVSVVFQLHTAGTYGVRILTLPRELGLTKDYPRLDESLSVLVERFPSLQPLAGAEFLQ